MTVYIEQKLCTFLEENVEGFSRLKEEEKRYTAFLLHTNISSTRYQHSTYPDCFFASYKYLEKVYGKTKFEKKMKKLSPELIRVEHAYELSEGTTKAYKITDEAYVLLEEYFTIDPDQPGYLIDRDSGKRLMKGRSNAIHSKTDTGLAVKTQLKFSAKQQVNVREMKRCLDIVSQHCEMALNDEMTEFLIEEYGVDYKDKLYRSWSQLSQLIQFSESENLDGELMLHYKEATSGRLYGVGVHLQNAMKKVRNAALSGMYDYDIENCHFALITQMASWEGVKCEAINDYMARKKEVRQTLADDIEITVKQVKTCLLAMVYGAGCTLRKENAIPKAIGIEQAQKLYNHSLFKGLFGDLKKARKAIIAASKAGNNQYVNAMGRTTKEKSERKSFSHLIQGMEAKILNEICAENIDDIVLLQHDGWVTRNPIDVNKTIERVHRNTGIKIELSSEIIEADFYEISPMQEVA